MEPSSDLLRPVSTGRYTVFCDPSQQGTILYWLFKWSLWPSDTQWNPHQHTETSSLDLLQPVSTGRYTVFCDPFQRGSIQYLLLKWHWAFATHLYIICESLALWPSDIFCAWGFPLDASHRQLYLFQLIGAFKTQSGSCVFLSGPNQCYTSVCATWVIPGSMGHK